MDMRHKAVALATVFSMSAAPLLLAANGPSMATLGCAPSLTSVGCASSGAPVKVTANIQSPAATAKVYFKAAGQTEEYYVDMRRTSADGTMTAFIPAPARSTPSFTYRVVAMDATGVQVATPLSTATVTPSCPAQNLTADQQRAANNLIIGLTTPTQHAVPTGFLCRGIVSYIDTDGDLRPNEECRRVVATGIDGTPSAYASSATTNAAGTGASSATGSSTIGSSTATGASTTNTVATGASTSAGAGTSTTVGTGTGIAMSHGTIVALTVASLAGVGAVIAKKHNHNNNNSVSPSRP